ncbi:MAG: hypothetical protein P4N24_10455 [Acidobacteriota bacterium]|nr:hypothetical protein [Acidobacteriota bacterium]
MNLVKSSLCLGLVVLALGIATRPTLGDDDKNQANWDKLKQLSAGQEVEVVENDAKSNRGDFRSVTDEAIVVATATDEKNISRQSVARVSSKGKPHRMRNALIGAGIGAGAGAGIGAATAGCTSGCFGFTRGNVMGALSAVGGIVGAIIGAVIPSGGWHEVYRAR